MEKKKRDSFCIKVSSQNILATRQKKKPTFKK